MSVVERQTSGGRVCKQSSFQPTACSMLLNVAARSPVSLAGDNGGLRPIRQ